MTGERIERIRQPGPGPAWTLAVFLLIGLSDSALAQNFGRVADDEVSIWRVAAATLACLAVAVAAALFLKYRLNGGGAQFLAGRKRSRLEMVEVLRIKPQIDLCIVACDGEELLMLASPQGASLLRFLPRRNAQSVADIVP